MTMIKSKLSPPPILIGYTYSSHDAYEARDNNKLLAIRVETNYSCNLKCRYCYAMSGKSSQKFDYNILRDVILQAKELGIHSVVIIGGGEPTLYPEFNELITFIDSLDIIPMIFSNTILINKDLANFLYNHNASIMGKLDSLKPELTDYLAGKKGAYSQINRGLKNLMEAGFIDVDDSTQLRLGISFVSNKLNLYEVEDIWHFCRKNNIFPNMEILTPTGRAKSKLASQKLTKEEIMEYKLKILNIDREMYNYDWLPYTPLTASGCLQHLYSLYITLNGDVRPCAPTKFDQHPFFNINGKYPYNIHNMGLKEIIKSELFTYVRHIDKHLEGKCKKCEHLDECIGCRGYAYSVGINNGMNPLKALQMECQQCLKKID